MDCHESNSSTFSRSLWTVDMLSPAAVGSMSETCPSAVPMRPGARDEDASQACGPVHRTVHPHAWQAHPCACVANMELEANLTFGLVPCRVLLTFGAPTRDKTKNKTPPSCSANISIYITAGLHQHRLNRTQMLAIEPPVGVDHPRKS